MKQWHRKLVVSVVTLLAAAGLSGCLAIADRAVTEDLKSVEHEFQVFQADAALFRQCLHQRGGACSGDAATPMPHSSQAGAGQQVSPMTAGSSKMLSDSLAEMSPNDPARMAATMLDDPVIRQAMALHDHLRGMPVSAVDGVSVALSRGISDVKESVFTLHMKLDQIVHFHDLLLGSIGTTAWESLLGHCAMLLKRHRGEPNFSALEADCRTAAFIRGYLDAYFRHGKFLEVDVKLAGAIQALDNAAARIKQKIATIQTGISALETDTGSAVTGVGSAAEDVGADIQDLISKLEADISSSFGPGAAAKFARLADLGSQVGSKSGKLQGAGGDAANRILLSDINLLLMKIDHELTALAAIVGNVDQRLVGDINAGLLDVDKTLSNVFKVSTVGFVNRDITFQARLPTLEVTFDPTAKRLVTLTDIDTGQIISGKSDLNMLGVVNDQSGVGTGAAIGAEVVRVFLEAIFDAHEGLPALAPIGQAPKATGLTLGEYSLPLFTSPMGNVDATDLSNLTHFNDSVAAGTRVISGRIISGIGPLSLNNPPLEDLIVEILATAVRKSAEKASWCWYACNLDVDAKALKTDAGKTVDAAAASVADKLRADAERVRLRFRLSK